MSVNLPPPSYVPPSASRRSGPGCWIWGFCTCLVVFVLFAVLIAVSIEKATSTVSGQKSIKSIFAAIHTAQQLTPCVEKMKAIQQAAIRYHTVKGTYPPNLEALVPTYLPGPSPLHCSIDPNPDPSHVSFEYKRPSDDAPGSTIIVSTDWSYTIDNGDQKQTVVSKMSLTLDGKMYSSQSQSTLTGTSYNSGSRTYTYPLPPSRPSPVSPPPGSN